MIVNPRGIAAATHDAWPMTTHDLTALSHSIKHRLALAGAAIRTARRSIGARMRASGQREARRDAYAEKAREREERRRLWGR